jgi:hypothetical protein
MLIKKLAAPLINEKLLQQAEHCYIASASISEAGFNFIRSRIPPKCKMDLVTGLDVPTSPQVLRRIWRNYQGRITLNVYTRNVFHSNVYIFDLPFRKAVAFIGSGDFTLEGLKDREELFYKITDAKQIEELKSWFTGYFEFAEPLNEALMQEYELLYPSFKQREIASRQEKEEFVLLTTAGFNWEGIKFKNQFFQKEHYLTFANDRAHLTTPEVVAQREEVRNKLVLLHDSIKEHVHKLKLFENSDINCLVNSIAPTHYSNQKVRSLSIGYSRGEAELKKISQTQIEDVVHLQLCIKPQSTEVSLYCGIGKGKVDREYLKDRMLEEEYRNQFFKLVTGLGAGYWIEVMGEKRKVETFQQAETLAEFTKSDDWRYYAFSVGTKYSPGDPAISSDNISKTMMQEFDKLVLLYSLLLKV